MSIENAIALRTEKRFEDSKAMFQNLESSNLKNAEFYYQFAWLLDNMNDEKEASYRYQKAIDLRIEGESLKGCLLGLGSSYRNIGELEKSLMIFEYAIGKFPENYEFHSFKALTLHDMNRKSEAISELLKVIIETSDNKGIEEYKTALKYYSNQLSDK